MEYGNLDLELFITIFLYVSCISIIYVKQSLSLDDIATHTSSMILQSLLCEPSLPSINNISPKKHFLIHSGCLRFNLKSKVLVPKLDDQLYIFHFNLEFNVL